MSQSGVFFEESGTGTVTAIKDSYGTIISPDTDGRIIIHGVDPVDTEQSADPSFPNMLNITVSGGGLKWTTLIATGPAVGLANNGYICDFNGITQINLPATSAIGSIIEVLQFNIGVGAGFQINCAGKIILWGGATTATTALNYYNLSPFTGISDQYGSVRIVCVVADAVWMVTNAFGSTFITA